MKGIVRYSGHGLWNCIQLQLAGMPLQPLAGCCIRIPEWITDCIKEGCFGTCLMYM